MTVPAPRLRSAVSVAAARAPLASTPAALAGQLAGLRHRIDAQRRKFIGVTLSHGALIVLGVLTAIVCGEMLLDWLVDFPWLVRLVIFLGAAALIAGLARARLLLPWRRRPGEDAVALMIERALPIFRGRYIVSLQLAGDGLAAGAAGPPTLVRALVAETVALAAGRRYGHVVRTAGLKQALKWALAVVAALAVCGYFAGGSGWILFKRALLFNDPVPTKTRVVDTTGNRLVAVGDDLPIEATAAGLVPGKPGSLIITELPGNVRTEFSFDPVPGRPARFGRLVASVQNSFDYFIRLGDGHSAVFHVATRPRPALAALEAEQIYPAYAQLPNVRRSLNDLTLLAGSRLRLRGHATVEIKAGSVRLSGTAAPPPVPIQLTGPRDLSADVPIPAAGVSGFSVSLVDPDGIETRDPTVYRIDVVPDLPPMVKIVYPDRREELVTTRARLLIAFEAADDIGLAQLVLHYKVVHAAEGALDASTVEKSLQMNLDGQQPRDLKRRYEWRIADLKPPVAVGTTIEYWFEAFDANNVTGPGTGQSEHYTARAVTDQEKLADLMNRAADTLGGLGEMTGREEILNKQLGTMINDKAAAAPGP